MYTFHAYLMHEVKFFWKLTNSMHIDNLKTASDTTLCPLFALAYGLLSTSKMKVIWVSGVHQTLNDVLLFFNSIQT
jgi:hypothetical protein